MSMITALLFLSLLAFSAARHPTCPNNQEPKLNEDGTLVQCLPGASQTSTCGASHTCFFSGMNYMCCPSNEPNAENLPSCPKSSLTVLDSNGLPMKCSPRTRQCPQNHMFCTDVGLAFICCDKQSTVVQESGEVQYRTVKKVLKRRKMKTTTIAPELSHECPEGTIGLLDEYGEPKKCTASSGCTGFNQFCHGGDGGPICCERVEYAMNKLDLISESTIPSLVKTRSKQLVHVPLVSNAVEGTGHISRPNILASGENIGHKSKVNALPIAVAVSRIRTKSSALQPVPSLLEKTSTTTTTTTIASTTEEEMEATEPLIVFSTTEEPTTKARAFAIRTNTRENEFVPVKSLSRGKASELLNGEEKRAMAQRFLMHQIRNGWPYDDRFYRPDMDAFTNEQRQDIAKLRFIDN